jgi:hypothetical protein
VKYQKGESFVEVLFYLAFGGALFAAWITHLVICFQGNRWGFLIAGALFFPVAIVHGVGIWFSWW